MTLEDLELPEHIHLQVLRGRDITTGEDLAYPVLWADRDYDRCPSCGQPIPYVVQECPVALNVGAGQGGALQDYSQQHGCGEWLTVTSVRFDDGETDEVKILAAAAEMALTRKDGLFTHRKNTEEKLEQELAAATAQLLAPLGDGETVEDRLEAVCTGSEVEPGVYIDGGYLTVWDYDAVAADGDTIAATSTFPFVFTVQVQDASGDGGTWQGLAPAEVVIADNMRRLALDTARNQTLTSDGVRWRVAVWAGSQRYGIPELFTLNNDEVSVEVGKERLRQIREEIRTLERDRNNLMATLRDAGVSARELASLTGVSHPTVGNRIRSASGEANADTLAR